MGYERLNLKTGQVITEDVFAHLEDGIEGAANAVLMTPILYADLVALRNAGQLKAGMFYRITDYVTTTTQEKTQSAGHQFDIIVLALSESKLSEQAYAAIHEGDTYFTEAGANLAAWKIWYCVDNDVERFAWASGEDDTCVKITGLNEGTDYNLTHGLIVKVEKSLVSNLEYSFEYAGYPYQLVNGNIFNEYEELVGTYSEVSSKGVIYRMIDEWNNDCPHDFKNILYNKEIGEETVSLMTFADDLAGGSNANQMMPCIKVGKAELSFNTMGEGCFQNFFDFCASHNHLGGYVSNCSFGKDANHNTLSADCRDISLGMSVKNCRFYDETAFVRVGDFSSGITCEEQINSIDIGMDCHTIDFELGGEDITIVGGVNKLGFYTPANHCIVLTKGNYERKDPTIAENVFIGLDSNGNLVEKNIFD